MSIDFSSDSTSKLLTTRVNILQSLGELTYWNFLGRIPATSKSQSRLIEYLVQIDEILKERSDNAD
jgi:hypothetical protein